MRDIQTGFWRRHRWLKWTIGVSLAGLAVLTGVVLVLAHNAEPIMRAGIVQGLEDHFHSHVELDSFHLTLKDGLWAEGKGLRIWPPSEVEGITVPDGGPAKPLIRLDEFRFHAPMHYDPQRPIRITVVRLKGLDVDLPPRPHFTHGAGAGQVGGNSDSPSGATAEAPGAAEKPTGGTKGLFRFTVEHVECDGAHLTIETSKPGKLPVEFAIAHLKMTDIGDGGPMGFEAELTNPRPKGTVYTKGSLGPWSVADPGESPVNGDYKFEDADLGTFNGIAGILNSTGQYQGTLREMEVNGETDTPDFQLTHFGSPLPLHSKFRAKVDGTNGDTQLESVEATLGHSHFWVQGRVVRVIPAVNVKEGPLGAGHNIALTVKIDRGRMEDFLRLTSRSGTPALNGTLNMKAGLDIPPGQVPVHERLKLSGRFAIDDAQFTSEKIQERIGNLSARGLGNPKDAKNSNQSDVRSAMTGDFSMAGGVITLPTLEYTVPGAIIDLKGTYGVDHGSLSFAGFAKMQATVSEMVGGWKGMLLKPVDRYFKKDGAGTKVPIHIDGTREDPHFGVDFGRMKASSPQRPDSLRQKPQTPQ
ncbi:MAG TPA: hypothetical protein VH308_05900 [Terracidiphilus sp.]|nr:hypothetical protein [Terracidiphilus sp.]